MNNKKTTDSKV